MIVAYDNADAPFEGAAMLYLTLFTLLALGALLWRLTGRELLVPGPFAHLLGRRKLRSLPRLVPLALLGAALVLGLVPLIDRVRVDNLDPARLHVVRGTITRTWEQRRTERAYDPFVNSHEKRTRTTQGFSVGDIAFTWPQSRCTSSATLCAFTQSKVPLHKGMQVVVTWFTDPLSLGRRRIVRIETSEPDITTAAAHQFADRPRTALPATLAKD